MADLKTNFNLRSSTSDKPQSIFLVCRWNKKRLVYPTDISITPDLWDNDKQLPKTKHSNFTETKYRLTDIKTIAENEYRKFVNNADTGVLPTVEDLRRLLYKTIKGVDIGNADSTKLDFFQFYDYLIKERENELNPHNGKKYSTAAVYELKTTKEKIQSYLKTTRKKSFSFDDVTLDFYLNFTAFLNKKNYSTNYVGKIVKNLKMVMNESRQRGMHQNLDYTLKRFKKTSEETPQIYLNVEELQRFENVDLSNNPRLDRVRDLLILGAWTGLRFSDFTTITKRNIYLDTSDGDYIEKKTKKTGHTVVIPIFEPVRRIIDKYNGRTANSLPKIITNQRFNDYIKELGELIGLDEPIETGITKGGMHVATMLPKYQALSSHVCRRSFATNAFKMGVPTITIREITGHNTEVAFLRYIRATPKEHANKMREIMTRKLNPPIKKVG